MFRAAFTLQVSYPSGSHRTCRSRRRMHHRLVCTSAVLWGRGPKAPTGNQAQTGNMVYSRRMVYLRRSAKGRGDACVAPTPGPAAALLIPPPRARLARVRRGRRRFARRPAWDSPTPRACVCIVHICIIIRTIRTAHPRGGQMHPRLVCISAVLWGRGPQAQTVNMVYSRRMVYLRRSAKGRGDACVAPTPGPAAALLIPPPRARLARVRRGRRRFARRPAWDSPTPRACVCIVHICIIIRTIRTAHPRGGQMHPRLVCISAVLWGRGPQAQTVNMVYSRPAGKGRGDACVAPTPDPAAALLIPPPPRVCGLLSYIPTQMCSIRPSPTRAWAIG